jgi:putative endonuclease
MAKDNRSSGKKGEVLACKCLKKNKYKILEKNFRTRQGEIDIIAEGKNTVLCFVEVKARSRDDYGLPVEAITRYKHKEIACCSFRLY